MADRALGIAYGVLGPLELHIGGAPVRITSARQRALLAAMLVRANRPTSADRLVDAVWGDDLPADPRSSLHTLLHRLREALRASGRQPLRSESAGYLLEVGPGELDASRFEEMLAHARSANAEDALRTLDAGLALWRGAAYAEFLDRDFAQAEAVRLEELRLGAIEQRASIVLDLGNAKDAVAPLLTFVAENPFREGARLLLATALYRAGRPTEALSQLQDYRRLLGEELGLDPSPAASRLEVSILRHELGPPPSRDAAQADTATSTSWRPSATAFVGREDAAADLVTAAAANRLVTVVGVGGVGKTRLVAETIPELTRRLGLPARLAELGAATAVDVDATVARALGLRPSGSPGEVLIEYLSIESLLLILDNCEHVAATVRDLVDRILRGCPNVRVIATSRLPLRSREEQVLPLQPLHTPKITSDFELSAPVRLFADSARRVRPSFALTTETLPIVVDICRRVEGLPLGLELAAARAASLGPRALRDRLADNLELLNTVSTSDSRGPRTLRGVVDWSYELLGPRARQLFDTLAVFEEGFDLEAAERVAAVHADVRVAAEVAALVDASLVVAETLGDTVRYRMLTVIQDYAAELLSASGLEDTVRLAHAGWVRDLTRAAAQEATGPGDRDAFRRVDRERANVRSALRWCLSHAEPGLAADVAGALASLYHHHADSEVFAGIREIAENPGVRSSDVAPLALAAASRAACLQGDLDEARRLAEGALKRGASMQELYLARHSLGIISLYRGDLERSTGWWTSLLDIDDLPAAYRIDAYASLALISLYRGDLPAADASIMAAKTALDAAGAQAFGSFTAYVEGEIELLRDPPAALALLDQAVDRARAADANFVVGLAGTALASASTRLGRHEEALARFGAVLEHWRRVGAWPQIWTTMRILAELLTHTGKPRIAALLLAAADSSPSAPAVTGEDAARLADLHRRIRADLGIAVHDRIAAIARTLPRVQVLDRAFTALGPGSST